jgi:hypothetical protein
MKYTLFLLPFLASGLSAQDEVWKNLAKGDRVQITFRTGNMITGQLEARPGDPRIKTGEIDYSQGTEVTIDVSLEYPGVNGTMTIPRKEIKEIRKLQNLDPATVKRLQDEIRKITKQTQADDAARKADEAERDKAAAAEAAAAAKRDAALRTSGDKGKDLVKEAEELQRGMDLLVRFPPDKWGPQTIKEMADKALRKQPITPDERDFTDPETQRLWTKALQYTKENAPKEKATTDQNKQ